MCSYVMCKFPHIFSVKWTVCNSRWRVWIAELRAVILLMAHSHSLLYTFVGLKMQKNLEKTWMEVQGGLQNMSFVGVCMCFQIITKMNTYITF